MGLGSGLGTQHPTSNGATLTTFHLASHLSFTFVTLRLGVVDAQAPCRLDDQLSFSMTLSRQDGSTRSERLAAREAFFFRLLFDRNISCRACVRKQAIPYLGSARSDAHLPSLCGLSLGKRLKTRSTSVQIYDRMYIFAGEAGRTRWSAHEMNDRMAYSSRDRISRLIFAASSIEGRCGGNDRAEMNVLVQRTACSPS